MRVRCGDRVGAGVLSPVTAEQRDLCDQAARVPAVAFAVAFVFWHSALSIAVYLSLVKTEENIVNTSWWKIACGKWSFSQEVVKRFTPVAKQSLLVFGYADSHGHRGTRPGSLYMLCSLYVCTCIQRTLLET